MRQWCGLVVAVLLAVPAGCTSAASAGVVIEVILYALSATVTDRGLAPGTHAWTRAGRAVPEGPIPLDRINGPVITIAGGDDLLGQSVSSARYISAELDRARYPFPHQELIYPYAGHQVGTFPFLAQGIRFDDPRYGGVIRFGGSRAADAAARERGWPLAEGPRLPRGWRLTVDHFTRRPPWRSTPGHYGSGSVRRRVATRWPPRMCAVALSPGPGASDR